MHRVELKERNLVLSDSRGLEFLMHRVELKVNGIVFSNAWILTVPNAPCGVESFVML